MASTLTQRKKFKEATIVTSQSSSSSQRSNNSEPIAEEPKLTLPEEILLLALKDREGHPSFWNDCLSSGLRGCILIELSFRDRIKLEEGGIRHKDIRKRMIVLKDETLTGDIILDETIKHIKSSQPCSVENWIEYLTGDSWNPLNLKFQLRNVRERIAKNLVEKGVLTNSKQNYLFFDLKTYPLSDGSAKREVIRKAQNVLLARWNTDPQQLNRRQLALVVMAHISDVLENALESLNDEEYDLALSRMGQLLKSDLDAEFKKAKSELFWAVFAAFIK